MERIKKFICTVLLVFIPGVLFSAERVVVAEMITDEG